ncbi:EF-P 5-aminopentanol modification-associated protein YfmF [Tumebacillus algifaecis]|nr:pitrilysin family protein [Tumebacillus algifaecis]
MNQFQTREERGIYVHVLPTDKFRMNTIVATFTQELREETATPLAVLPYLLNRGSERYPTPEKLQLALDELYGASLSAIIDKKGERQVVDFSMNVPNEKFLKQGEGLFKKALGILSDVMLRPRLEDGAFLPEYVQAEKEQHKKRLAAVIDDKIVYAGERCIQEMTKGEPFAIPRLGYEERIDEITPQSLYAVYQELLKTAPIHIYVIGDVEIDQVVQDIFSVFNMERDPQLHFQAVQVQHETHEVKEVVERLAINQGKLNIGVWSNVAWESDDYAAMHVCNGVLGAFPHSKLFVNVREKHSLAYYCMSRLEGHKGIISVYAGVEFDKIDQAVDIIREQFETIKKGDISAEEMEFTISALINAYKTAMDTPTSFADFHLNGLIAGRVRTREEMIEAFQKVTVEDVVRVAQGLQFDTIYTLRNEEGNHGA